MARCATNFSRKIDRNRYSRIENEKRWVIKIDELDARGYLHGLKRVHFYRAILQYDQCHPVRSSTLGFNFYENLSPTVRTDDGGGKKRYVDVFSTTRRVFKKKITQFANVQ